MFSPEKIGMVLGVMDETPKKAIDLARSCGLERASDINPTLYHLKTKGLVVMDETTKTPMWKKPGIKEELVEKFKALLKTEEGLQKAMEFLQLKS